jgi:hypothetical protein
VTFLDVLKGWHCDWMWKGLKVIGSNSWMYNAIKEGSLIEVTDVSSIRELYQNVSAAAVLLECHMGRGQLVLSLTEHSLAVLGLLALHLLLLSFNMVHSNLSGKM